MTNQVSILLIAENNLLTLQYRENKASIKHPACWGLFGGSIEYQESPACAIVRELREELNLDVTKCVLLKKLTIGSYADYLFLLKKITINHMELEEGSGVGFFKLSIEDLPINLVPNDRIKIDWYLSQ